MTGSGLLGVDDCACALVFFACSVDSRRTNVSFFLIAIPPTLAVSADEAAAAAAFPPLTTTAPRDLLDAAWPKEEGGVLVANTGGVLDPKDGGVLSGVRGEEEPAEPVNSYVFCSIQHIHITIFNYKLSGDTASESNAVAKPELLLHDGLQTKI